MNGFLIFLYGGVGCLTRFLIFNHSPFALWIVNILGSFLSGLNQDKNFQIGFLGGLTTFSAFTSYGADQLHVDPILGFLKIQTHVFLGILFFVFGTYLRRKLWTSSI